MLEDSITPTESNFPKRLSSAHGACLAALVDSLASPDFESCLMAYLNALAGAEHCVIYALRRGGVELLGAISIDESDFAITRATSYIEDEDWKHDAGFNAAFKEQGRSRTALMRVEKADTVQRPSRSRVLQKLFLFGARRSLFGISVLKSPRSARFTDSDLRRMGESAELVLSFCDQHQIHRHHDVPQRVQLDSLSAIEMHLAKWLAPLTDRERQVCAHILYGMSIEGISLDLGIKPESAVTYKKRAFHKCGIATRHELFRSYLKSFSTS